MGSSVFYEHRYYSPEKSELSSHGSLLMRSWFLQKKKLMGSWSHTITVTNSELLYRLPVQIECHRRDPAGHEENMSPGLEAEAQGLAEPELAWTNKSGANRAKEL
ncbi:hypothetical protein VPH35_103926 [Triticum aestivum]